MSITDQALFLLDIQPSKARRHCPESFGNLDPEIGASICPAPLVSEAAAASSTEPSDQNRERANDLTPESSLLSSVQTPFAVAARMGRPDYEEKAKAEALHEALRQMRAKHAAKRSPRVIRGS